MRNMARSRSKKENIRNDLLRIGLPEDLDMTFATPWLCSARRPNSAESTL